MIRQVLTLILASVAAACAVGPNYHPEAVVPEKTQVGTAGSSASARQFFDSLAAARDSDTVSVTAKPAARVVLPDSLPGLAWVDVFRDSTLLDLVRSSRWCRTGISRPPSAGFASSGPMSESLERRCSPASVPTAV